MRVQPITVKPAHKQSAVLYLLAVVRRLPKSVQKLAARWQPTTLLSGQQMQLFQVCPHLPQS